MSLELEPLSEAIGARIHGVDLQRPLAADDREALRRALDEHLALFYDGPALTREELVAFGESLGPLDRHAFAPVDEEVPEMVVLDQLRPVPGGADVWHADATFTKDPPWIGILTARVLPTLGGDTCFASAIAAFEALSPRLQRLLERVRGVHDLTGQLSVAIANDNFEGDLREMQTSWPPVSHPAVLRHPRTGRRGLFVNSVYTTRLEGVSPTESEQLLAFLREHMRSPELQCRFRWEVGSIAIWDNRFVQHFAVPDYDERRLMWRLNVTGEPIESMAVG